MSGGDEATLSTVSTDDGSSKMEQLLAALEIRLLNNISGKIADSESKVIAHFEKKFTELEEKLVVVEGIANTNTQKINANTILANATKIMVTQARTDINSLITSVQSLDSQEIPS